MALSLGTRLGPYEILSQIGAGGMGEVYKARDTRLNRPVAIKVLPDHVADAESRARLEREARAISSLDHPHICALYDVGQHGDTYFIVMQYLEGQTLADRLARGPLPLDLALRIAIEIAAALEHAHRAGIVHRDLKPANVMLAGSGARGAGSAKLLDFGLAKPQSAAGVMGFSDKTTLAAAPVTAEGAIVGTVRYMSPEQIEGKDADMRTDVFAFGVVLHEMITGAPPFDGPTPASIIGSILRDTPPAITERQPKASPALARIVAMCVAKAPDDRWQSASDMRHELQWVQSTLGSAPAELAQVSTVRGISPVWRVAAIAGLVATTVLTAMVVRLSTSAAVPDIVRYEIAAPPGALLAGVGASVPTIQFALSPDGRRIVFVGSPLGGRPALWLRNLATLQAQMLVGTEDALSPFWSPDGKHLGFFAQGQLKTIDLTSGQVQKLCPVAPDPRGGTWNSDNVIVFARTTNSGLEQINATGGVPTPALALRPGDASYRWPAFLSDGRHFVFYLRRSDRYGVYLGSLDGQPPTLLLEHTPFNAIASPFGYLVTMRDGTLLAYPFDERHGRLTGEPISVADKVSGSSAQFASFSVSAAGTIAYSMGLTTPSRLEWFDRMGKSMGPATPDAGDYPTFRISPNQQSVAYARVDPQTSTSDVWVLDFSSGKKNRFTTDPGTEASPVWSPDSLRIVYRSDQKGGNFAFIRPVSQAKQDEPIGEINLPFPTDWSPDGRYLAFHGPAPSGTYDVFVVDLRDTSKAIPMVDEPGTNVDGHFSPDGRWLAYSSDVSSQMEIYAQPFPRSGRPVPISTSGGTEPRWSRDGRELFYLAPDGKMMAVKITPGPTLVSGAPHALFQTHAPAVGPPYRINYDVTADGSKFLITTPVEGARTEASITVVLNWLSDIRKK